MTTLLAEANSLVTLLYCGTPLWFLLGFLCWQGSRYRYVLGALTGSFFVSIALCLASTNITWTVLGFLVFGLAVLFGRRPSDRPVVQSQYRSRRADSQQDFFFALEKLGFESYDEYLESDYWQEAKRRYRRSGLPQYCLVCRSVDITLHHQSYERLGLEDPSDLVPLCHHHHQELHDILDQHPDLCVKDTLAV